MNKNAAKKLALVLAQTQADKEKLKAETAALIKPEIDRCNEAMAAKDAAIQALVGEREKCGPALPCSTRASTCESGSTERRGWGCHCWRLQGRCRCGQGGAGGGQGEEGD